MVNKKIALMVGLLFTTAAVQADYTVTATEAIVALSPADEAAWVRFRSLSTSQQAPVWAFVRKGLTIPQAMRALGL